jgi:hypothetical protein
MPVEASDIVQTAMDTGDSSYTGCEEVACESDECVRKMTASARAASLSNQIHNAEVVGQRKPWKSRPTSEFSPQICPDNACEISAAVEVLFWKTRNKTYHAIYIPDARQHRPVPD